MRKIDKYQIIKLLIIIANIGFITIPYTIKNMKLSNDIQSLKSSISSTIEKEDKDLYKIYDEFNAILNKMDIKAIHKNATINDNSLNIQLTLDTNITTILNLLTYIDKDMPDMYIISSNINSQDKSDIVFYIEY